VIDVELEQVRRTFPSGVTALCDLSLRLDAGRRLALVGPSGSGKTTLLRLLAGLDRPTAGRIRFGGRDATDWPPRRRGAALVSQQPALFPHLVVRDNLLAGLRLSRPWWNQRHRDDDDRVAEVAGLLGVADLLARRPDELSAGQAQRVALGRALTRRPALLLLDEPFTALDAGMRAGLGRQLHRWQRRHGATTVLVTHDPAEALALGDTVAVLDGGRLRQAGTPAELLETPACRFVAGFVGWPPINFLDGEARGGQDDPEFVSQDWGVLKTAAPRPGPLTLGLRPEHCRLADGGAGAAVERLEPLAAGQWLVTVRRGHGSLGILAHGPDGPREGQTVRVAFDLRRALWFDPASGRSLSAAPASGGC
jgi:ABC-type sugar transport system ATPase subunit